jgi:hypothetical protein
MELTFACPECGVIDRVAAIEAAPEVGCRGCGRAHPMHRDAFDGAGLRSCPWCATADLYLQKDFPQGLGLVIVIAGFVVSTVFWYQERPVPALGVLLASALVDMALYYLVPDVTICYRCLGQYRGAGSSPDGRFRGFDLAIGERYRQEKLRIEQLRQRRPADSLPSP